MRIISRGKKLGREKILVRLTLMMILLSIISGAIILGVALNEQKDMMKKNLIEENKHLVSVAAKSIEAGIYMKPIVNEINNSKNVLFCWVVKPEGIIHLADDPDVSGKRAEGVPLETEEAVVEDYVFRDEDIKIVVHPFRVADSEKMWKLCTGISLKSVNEAVNRMILTSLGSFFLIIAFACGVAFFLARRFTKPITQLLEGTKAISRGDFDTQVKIKTGDEMEELGNAFNSMAQQIKKVISLEKEKTAREHIENIVNTMGETLIVVNPEGVVKRANKATFDLLGYGKEEVIGKPINKILPQKKAEKKLKIGKKSDTESFETSFSTKDGRKIPVIFSISPIAGEDGELKETVCVGTNIGERKRAEDALRESEKRYRLLVESSPDGIVIHRSGKMIFTNSAGLTLLGYRSADEVLGKPVMDFVHPDSQDIVKERVGLMEETMQPMPFIEEKFIRSNGSPVDVEVVATPFIYHRKPAIQVIFRDISERKRAEKEREKLLRELEAKNAEMERFTYTVSHDLRSPLVTIQGFTGMLQKDLGQNEREKVENDLKYIENATTKMDRLLSDTLQLSRIGRVVNPPEDVPFGENVQEALEQTAEQIKSSGVEVSVADDFPAVHVDRMRIAEVLVNLITNSINYMGEQPHPKIDIGYRVDGKETTFFVKDNGIGIEPSQHEKVFELFYQVERNKGTGAGLAIVKRIIEVHGGRVWIESERGKGCSVCFTVPISIENGVMIK